MELNEGIRLLTGKAKIVLPLKKKESRAAGARSGRLQPDRRSASRPAR